MPPFSDAGCEHCARGSRDESFARLARRYGRDAAHDFRRSLAFGIVASGTTLAGATIGAWTLRQDDGALSRGVGTAALLVACSLPFWWAAERSRRSAVENRRLRRQAETVEAFVYGFEPGNRDTMRASLAQLLFSRTSEDDDPMRAPTWPTIAPVMADPS